MAYAPRITITIHHIDGQIDTLEMVSREIVVDVMAKKRLRNRLLHWAMSLMEGRNPIATRTKPGWETAYGAPLDGAEEAPEAARAAGRKLRTLGD